MADLQFESAQLKIQAEVRKAAAEAQAAAQILFNKSVQQQAQTALNSSTSVYQRYNPKTGQAGAVVNNPVNPIHPQAIQNTNALNAATVSLTGSHKAMNDGLRGLVQSLGMYSSTMSAIIPMMAGMAIGAGLKHMLDQGRDLEYQMTFIAKLTDGATISVEQFSKAMEGSQLTTKEGALGLRALAQAGLSAEDALIALPNVMNLAVVGEMQLGAAALVATGIMHAFNLQMTDMGHIIDVMTKAAAVSNTSVEGMATAIKTASVVSDQFGVSLEEISAGLVVMAKRNIDGTSAGTAMKNFITNLASTTPIASARMKQLGIDVYDAEGNLKTMSKIIPELSAAFVGLNEKTKHEALKDLFNERGRRAAAAMIDDLALYGTTLDTLTAKSDDFAASVVRALDHTVTGQMKSIANSFSLSMDKAFAETGDAWSNLLARFDEGAKSNGLKEFAVSLSNATVALVDNAGKMAAIGAATAGAAVVWNTYSAASAAATAAAVAANPALAVTALTLEAQAAAAAKAATATGVLSTVLARIFWPVAIVTALYVAYQTLASSVDEVAEAAERRNRESDDTVAKLQAETARIRDETAAMVLQVREHINLADAIKKVKEAKGELASQDRQGAITEAEKKLAELQAAPQPGGTATWKWLADIDKAQKGLANLRKEQADYLANEARQVPEREAVNVASGAQHLVESVKRIDDALALKSKRLQDYIDKVGDTDPALTAKLNAARSSLSEFGVEINRLSKDAGSSRLAETTAKLAGSVAVLGQNAKNAIASADKLLETKDKVKPNFGGGPRPPHVEQVKLETTNIREEMSKRDKLVLDAQKTSAANQKAVLDSQLAANMISKARYAAEIEILEEKTAAATIANIEKQQEAREAAAREADVKVLKAQEEFNKLNAGNAAAIDKNNKSIVTVLANNANKLETDAQTSTAAIKAIQDKARTDTIIAENKHQAELYKIRKDTSDWEISEAALKAKSLRAIMNAEIAKDSTPLEAAVLSAESAEFERLTANAEKYDVQIAELTKSTKQYEEDREKGLTLGEAEAKANKKELETLSELSKRKAQLTGVIPIEIQIKGTQAADAFIRNEVTRIRDALTDAIMNAGKDGGKGVRDIIEAELVTKPFKIMVNAVLNPIAEGIAQGIMGQAAGEAVEAAGGSGFTSVLQGASLAASTFGANLFSAATAVATGAQTFGEVWQTSTIAAKAAGSQMTGIAMKIGAAAPYVAAAYAAAKVATGLIDRANGSVTAAGTFAYGHNSADGFKTGGRADFIQEGGGGTTLNSSWFDPGEVTSKYMSAMGELVTTSVKEWAVAIGLSADAVTGYTETVQAAIGNGMSKEQERQSIDKAMAGYGDAMVQALFGEIMAFANSGETPSAVLERLGNDVTAVNNILRDNGHQLYDTSFESAKAVQVLIDSVGGLDKFTALASNLESVNTVLTKLGKDTFELSMDGAMAADELAKSVGGSAKLSIMADELIHVNDNLAKLGEPLLDISVASAQAAHSMLTATDSAVKAKEAAEKLEASYASFTASLSGIDNNSVASLQAAFNKAMAAVTASIPSISGAGGLTSVTYDQYSSYTDPQRTKLDTAANAFKNLQDAINSAAKTAQDAAKTAQDAADTAAQAYQDALKSVEDSTRDVNRQLRNFGKTDFQKKLSAISDGGQDKQAELDKLSAKAAELSAVASDASLKATAATLGTVSTISNELIKASTDLSNDSQEVADNIKTTLANSTEALGDALTLAPAISGLFDSILAGLLKIPPALTLVSGAVTAVGGAAANAAGGLTAFSGAASAAGSSAQSATGPIASVGAAFDAAAPAANALGGAFDTAAAALTGLTGAFGAASAAIDGLNAAFASAASGLSSLGSAFESAGAAGASLAGSLSVVSGALSAISGAAENAAGSISAAATTLSAAGATSAPTSQLPSTAPLMFADGGYIRGAGTTTSDSIPTMLSDKEFVVRASSVAKYGTGFLDAINAGVLPKTVYRAFGDPSNGAVANLNEAERQLVYVGEFERVVALLGGVVTQLEGTNGALDTIAVKAPTTYTQALAALNSGGADGKGAKYDATGLDAAGVSKLLLDVLKANPPTQQADGSFAFSTDAQAALAPFTGGVIDALMIGLDAMKPWQDKLNVLAGKTTDRELALRNDLASTTDAATQELIKEVYAQEDLKKAIEDAAKAVETVQTALQSFQKEGLSLTADLYSVFDTPESNKLAKGIRKDSALEEVHKLSPEAGLLAKAQYDLNEARKAEITLLGDAKSRLKSYTDAGASKDVEIARLKGDTAGADAAQKAIDLADVYKSTADATELLKTEGLTPLDIAALNLTISTNKATEAQYVKNKSLDDEIEIFGRYKSAKEDADATSIELMKAMGNTAGAAAVELANATKGFTDAQIATYRQTQATKGLIAAYDNLSSTADMVTNSRIGLLDAQGDPAGASELRRSLDIKPYVTAIADATRDLGTATTEAEKEILNSVISTNKGAIGNYDLSKSLDKEAQAATDAKAATDALAQAYKDMQGQIEQAKVALLRASGATNAADELEFAIATREHEGDIYYASLYRELVTLRKLTEVRQQLNTLEDSALQNQIKLKRANGEGASADALERSAFLKNASLPAAQAKAEIDRSNVSFASLLQSRGLEITGNDSFGLAGLSGDLSPEDRRVKSAYYDEQTGTPGNQLNILLREFAQIGRTTDQKASLQNVVDTSAEIVKAYDRNKALEAELKIIELQDEAYKQNLDAQKAVTDAQKAYADVLKSTIGTMRDFLSTLDGAASPLQNLSSARDNFQAVAGKAASGDTSAYKDLTPAAKTFLDLSKNYSKTIQDYQRDEARVRATLNAVIRVNQNELDKLPQDIAKAADPTKDAWLKLQEATAKEADTSIMLTAISVDKAASTRRLRTAEETLADQYLESVLLLEEANKQPLLKVFNDALKTKVDDSTLPEYTAFNLGDIWGKKIAHVLPQTPLTNADLNQIIADHFPGLEPSDFLTALTSAQLTALVNGVMPAQLTAANFVSTTADVSNIVSTQIGEILPANFAGAAFNAQQMMQTAINNAMSTLGAGTHTPNVSPDPSTTHTNNVQTQGLAGTSNDIYYPGATSWALWIDERVRSYRNAGKHFADLVNSLPGDGLVGPGLTFETVPDASNFLLQKAKVIPFAVGTNYVPHDMLAQIHEGEAIIPAPFNPAKYNKDSGNDVLVAEIKALRAEVESLRKSNEAGQNAIAANTGKTARMLTKFDIDGIETRA